MFMPLAVRCQNYRPPAHQSWPHSAITTGLAVFPLWEPTASIFLTTSIPSVTEPKTTCLPSSQAVLTVQRKNWEPCVLQGEVLVCEFVAIDGLATSPVSSREVAALAHEVGDHPVEAAPFEVKGLARFACPLLAGAEGPEVLRRFGDHVGAQLPH